jgi:hypothetical protein
MAYTAAKAASNSVVERVGECWAGFRVPWEEFATGVEAELVIVDTAWANNYKYLGLEDKSIRKGSTNHPQFGGTSNRVEIAGKRRSFENHIGWASTKEIHRM